MTQRPPCLACAGDGLTASAVFSSALIAMVPAPQTCLRCGGTGTEPDPAPPAEWNGPHSLAARQRTRNRKHEAA
jgi:DnaJ-class molecular chaperone